MHNICIIADDLTGSTDTGVQFSKYGLPTIVVFDYTTLNNMENIAAALSVNAETRKLDEDTAYQRVREVVQILRAKGLRHFYKKIDSTLRGHPGKEIEAILDELGLNLAFIVPSFPATGRTMENGYLFIRRNSSADRDKRFPLGYVPGILEGKINRPLALIDLEDVRRGAPRIGEKIAKLKKAGRQIIVIDAVTEEDLLTIALALKEYADEAVVAGSAGLAGQLPKVWETKGEQRGFAGEGSLLFVAGTMNPVTAHQITSVTAAGLAELVLISSRELITGDADREIARVAAEAAQSLGRSQTTVIAVDSLLQSKEESYQSEIVLSNSHKIAESLGAVALKLAAEGLLQGVVATGGDTAIHIFSALGASGMILEDEVLPGIPRGKLVGGEYDGLPVITKAGGFGDKESFIKIIDHLTKTQGGETQ